MKIHPNITVDLVTEAARRSMFGMDNPGFCNACGIEVESGCEPDMRKGLCESCGEHAVYGAEELLLYLVA